ncbi:MAG: hypothetical protein GQ583_07625 [Methyloprofundus sp.]|nr:hypothetical protein [Methyloprofundus sp.]
MKKITVILLYGFISIAQAELVRDKSGIDIGNSNLEVLLEEAPVYAQVNLLKNRKKLYVQLERLYLRDAVAQMAIQEGLDKEGMNAERLQAIRNKALYLLKLDALKKSNKKDYSPYAKQVYLVNQEDYPIEERVNAAHILISTKKRTDAEALGKAQKIREELTQGEVFSTLALQESDDKSVKDNLGELGNFSRDQMVKPFSDVVFAMQVGTFSEPVKTQYGYHIIKLNKKLVKGVKSFEEVKDSIITKLKEKDWERTRKEFFEQLKKDNKMQIDDKAVDEFVRKKLNEFGRR